MENPRWTINITRIGPLRVHSWAPSLTRFREHGIWILNVVTVAGHFWSRQSNN